MSMTQQEKNEYYFKLTKGSFVLDETKSFPEDYFLIGAKGFNHVKLTSDRDCQVLLSSKTMDGQAINKPVILEKDKPKIEIVGYENQRWNFEFIFEPSVNKPTIAFELMN